MGFCENPSVDVITSSSNSHVKYIRSLGTSRRKRRHERRFVLEGVRLVEEPLSAAILPHLLLYAPDQLATTDAGRQLLDRLSSLPNCYEATPSAIAASTDTVTPQGVVGVFSWPDFAPTSGVWLILDEIQDPGNVGTLLRSAEAVGAGAVLCSSGTADLYSPKVVRSAMGAHFTLPVCGDLSWEDIAAMVGDRSAVYAAVAEAPTPYDAVEWGENSALIVGNEAQGIGDEGRALATTNISIPMVGHIGSLNAAVAGSVILFEALRQIRATNAHYAESLPVANKA